MECLYLELELEKSPNKVSCVVRGMLKTIIFDPDNPPGADDSPYRHTMYVIINEYSMNLDEGCNTIMQQIAAKRFWVST